jgi:hypothetical protein
MKVPQIYCSLTLPRLPRHRGDPRLTDSGSVRQVVFELLVPPHRMLFRNAFTSPIMPEEGRAGRVGMPTNRAVSTIECLALPQRDAGSAPMLHRVELVDRDGPTLMSSRVWWNRKSSGRRKCQHMPQPASFRVASATVRRRIVQNNRKAVCRVHDPSANHCTDIGEEVFRNATSDDGDP